MFVLSTSDFQVALWQNLQVRLLHLLLKSCFLGFLWGFEGDFDCENEQKDNPSRFCAGSFSSHEPVITTSVTAVCSILIVETRMSLVLST